MKNTPEEEENVPKSFIFNRGSLGKNTKSLMRDLRMVMSPYTASHLKATKRNSLKDFCRIAGPMGITHLTTISRSSNYAHLRYMVLSRGPTIDFEIREFSLMNSEIFSEKRVSHMNPYKKPAVLIMNNFSGKSMPHMSLVANMFQNLFPSLNITQTKLNKVKRAVLLHYDQETDLIYFRHYCIRTMVAGVSSNVRGLLNNKLPDMESLRDISDFVCGDKEAEEGEEADTFTKYTKRYHSTGVVRSSRAAVKLDMIGPSMTLKLVKIQEGISDKKVLYHAYVEKSAEEELALERKHQEKQELKLKRKRQQEENVARKKKSKDREAKPINSGSRNS